LNTAHSFPLLLKFLDVYTSYYTKIQQEFKENLTLTGRVRKTNATLILYITMKIWTKIPESAD
jgi:hypothetical protein